MFQQNRQRMNITYLPTHKNTLTITDIPSDCRRGGIIRAFGPVVLSPVLLHHLHPHLDDVHVRLQVVSATASRSSWAYFGVVEDEARNCSKCYPFSCVFQNGF